MWSSRSAPPRADRRARRGARTDAANPTVVERRRDQRSNVAYDLLGGVSAPSVGSTPLPPLPASPGQAGTLFIVMPGTWGWRPRLISVAASRLWGGDEPLPCNPTARFRARRGVHAGRVHHKILRGSLWFRSLACASQTPIKLHVIRGRRARGNRGIPSGKAITKNLSSRVSEGPKDPRESRDSLRESLHESPVIPSE